MTPERGARPQLPEGWPVDDWSEPVFVGTPGDFTDTHWMAQERESDLSWRAKVYVSSDHISISAGYSNPVIPFLVLDHLRALVAWSVANER